MKRVRKTRSAAAVISQPGGWELTPERAAIHRAERTAVIADVHLGYEWARGAAGDCVPAHSLEETLGRLTGLLTRAPIVRLVVAGDLVESARPCRRTAADLKRLGEWLEERGVALLALEGNHDRGRLVATGPSPRPKLPENCTIGGWTIAHGHRVIDGERTISGHFHPVLRAEGFTVPCFLAGPRRIILPAFSPNAAGCDVARGPVPTDWLDESLQLRCIASTGSDLLDFGPLPSLRRGVLAGRRVSSR